jgi:hypothetical protein
MAEIHPQLINDCVILGQILICHPHAILLIRMK